MFSVVAEWPVKLQDGLLYARVEVEQQTHSGDEIGSGASPSMISKNILAFVWKQYEWNCIQSKTKGYPNVCQKCTTVDNRGKFCKQ